MTLPNVALPWEMAPEPRGMLQPFYVDEQVAWLAIEVGTETVDYRYSHHISSVVGQPCESVLIDACLGQDIIVGNPSTFLPPLGPY